MEDYKRIENGFITDGEDDETRISTMVEVLKKLGWKADWDEDGDKFIVAPKDEFKSIANTLKHQEEEEEEEEEDDEFWKEEGNEDNF